MTASFGTFARRKNWFSGEMTPASVNDDIQNLRQILQSFQKNGNFGNIFINDPLTIYDDFFGPDRKLNGSIAPTGQTWVLSGTGSSAATVTNNMFVTTSNTYASLNNGTVISRIAGAFSMTPTGSGDNKSTLFALIADHDQIGLNTMLHLVITPNSWTLEKRLSGGAFTGIASGGGELQTDGTIYNVSMDISGDTCIVTPPLGPRVTVTDTDIGTILPQYGIWQITDNTGIQFNARWNACVLGPSRYSLWRALGEGMPSEQVTVNNLASLTADNPSVFNVSLLRKSISNFLVINGFSDGTTGKVITIINIDDADVWYILFKHNNASGTQKILCPGDVDLKIGKRGSASFIYDSTGFWFCTAVTDIIP